MKSTLNNKAICVFCGSSPGNKEAYTQAARELGQAMARRGHALVFGAGNVGLMKIVADAVLAGGGEAIGVIPRFMHKMDLAHSGLTELEVVETMHQRKARMAELSQAFIALPGGIGTLEELFEALTWTQLNLHEKPCALFNVKGYYTRLIDLLDHAVEEDFLKHEHRTNLKIADNAEALLDLLARIMKS